jgi:monovalent cation:proton antiporter-2 (CPA2) family protein
VSTAAHASVIPGELLVFLVAAVVAPPLFKRLKLGAVVGYLVTGIVIGPSLLRIFSEPGQILSVAELGVVLLLFVIGLELEPSRLLAMRRDIVALGVGQLALTTAALSALLWTVGLPPAGAVAGGFALSLSSTAVAVQLLNERGHLTRPYGQRSFAVLLAQDLAIVPALALIPALGHGESGHADWLDILAKVGGALAAITLIVLAGRYLIDPVLRRLARSGAREVMVAAALLLVAGAAVLAEAGGLSMALGAFLAGLLLSESSYRHELEANVEPFRGLLLALFFMGVGMNLDLQRTLSDAPVLLAAVIGLIAVKLATGALVFRLARSPGSDSLRAAALLAPASEFAFVLLPLAAGQGLMEPGVANGLAAVAVLSMMLGPPGAALVNRLLARRRPAATEPAIVEDFSDAHGEALVIGFGRFGQIAAQLLLAQGIDTTLIDNNADRIRSAARFGFKVYYGDGNRLEVLQAARADLARVILVCVENPEQSLQLVERLQTHFPLAKLLVRSYDRAHSLALLEKGVDYELRELFESSLRFGRAALEELGIDRDTALAVEDDVRERDLARLARQRAEGIYAGLDLLHQKVVVPEPLVAPERKGRALNPAAEACVEGEPLKEPA